MLRFVQDRAAPVTVRAVAQEWGAPRGLARTTILTVMERLRKKGYLVRRKNGADPNEAAGRGGEAFAYEPAVEAAPLMQDLVRAFVQNTLGGSVAPFAAYLADAPDLSERELAELRRVVESLETRDGDAPSADGDPAAGS